MKAPILLNAFALAIGLVAAILMARYPPRVVQIGKDGLVAMTFVSPRSEEQQRIGRRQQRLSELAPWLLALAFLLQFVALWLPG